MFIGMSNFSHINIVPRTALSPVCGTMKKIKTNTVYYKKYICIEVTKKYAIGNTLKKPLSNIQKYIYIFFFTEIFAK